MDRRDTGGVGSKKIKHNTYVKGRIGWQGLKSDEFIDEGPYLVTGTDFNDKLVNWNTCYHNLKLNPHLTIFLINFQNRRYIIDCFSG